MFNKLLASFAYPLGFALTALLVAGIAVAWGARRSGAVAAIILLGGALGPPRRDQTYPDLGEASDRVLRAFRIYKAGLGPKIVISGGNLFPDGRMAVASNHEVDGRMFFERW